MRNFNFFSNTKIKRNTLILMTMKFRYILLCQLTKKDHTYVLKMSSNEHDIKLCESILYRDARGIQYHGNLHYLIDSCRKGKDLTKQSSIVQATKTHLSPPSNLIRTSNEKQNTQKLKRKKLVDNQILKTIFER